MSVLSLHWYSWEVYLTGNLAPFTAHVSWLDWLMIFIFREAGLKLSKRETHHTRSWQFLCVWYWSICQVLVSLLPTNCSSSQWFAAFEAFRSNWITSIQRYSKKNVWTSLAFERRAVAFAFLIEMLSHLKNKQWYSANVSKERKIRLNAYLSIGPRYHSWDFKTLWQKTHVYSLRFASFQTPSWTQSWNVDDNCKLPAGGGDSPCATRIINDAAERGVSLLQEYNAWGWRANTIRTASCERTSQALPRFEQSNTDAGSRITVLATDSINSE